MDFLSAYPGKVILAADSPGRRESLKTLFKDAGMDVMTAGDWQEAFTVERFARGRRRVCGSEEGRKQIDVDHGLFANAARLGDTRPTNDKGNAMTTFMNITFHATP